MGQAATTAGSAARVRDIFEARIAAGETYFAASGDGIAGCAARMADRFFGGATLLVFGLGRHATDAQHNAVEFIHPALPGCRALPALSLTNDAAAVTALLSGDDPDSVFEHQLSVLATPRDIALAFAVVPLPAAVTRGLDLARSRGLQTVLLCSGRAAPDPGVAGDILHVGSEDASLAHELQLATYHMLWELVHIVLNHRGLAGGGDE
ncbi:MAG: phosphoheptose isomerase [Candidatus Dormibacteria bacterium]